MKGDLHVHSNVSDGSMTMEELIISACYKGIEYLSITDHDNTYHINEVLEFSKDKKIRIIPGVEISAYDFSRKRKVHILGYNFNLDAKNIKALCNNTLKRRNDNSLRQLNMIIEEGYDIDKWKVIEKASRSGVLYKQHIMEALIEAGYTKSIYSYLYKKLFKGNGICRGDITYVDAKEAVKAVKADGGLAVLAHPGELNSFDLLKELSYVGLDGVERNHPSHSIDDLILIDKLSYQYNLFKTGGSDYHGRYGSVRNLGEKLCPVDTLKIFN